MNVTPQRSRSNFSSAAPALSSRQHCSSMGTLGPDNRPSTLSTVFPRLFSVVILNIASLFSPTSYCMAPSKPHEMSLTCMSFILCMIRIEDQFDATQDRPYMGKRLNYGT